MTIITDIIGRQILDSRGNPTVEVDVILSDGSVGRASVPSGASKGKHESLELRDNTEKFNGLGVEIAVNNINTEIHDVLEGRSPFDQRSVDFDLIELDGTENKSRLGANAILGVSLAVCKAASKSLKIPLWRYIGGINSNYLPVPMMNVINGGAHANNGLDIQEFMIMPVGFNSFKECLTCGVEIFHSLRVLLDKNGYSTSVGDEGGFAPELKDSEQAINLICEAIELTKYQVGKHVYFAIDAAANEFFNKGEYIFRDKKKGLSSDELLKYWVNLVDQFPILSIEDPFHEDDVSGFINLNNEVGKKIQIVGDDLFVTSSQRLSEGIKKNAGNSILIKLNQVGSLSETLDTIDLAKKNDFNTIISHRSGETEDNFIANLAVACNSGQIKTGSVSRSDRNSKYNQLLRIEEELGDNAIFCGNQILNKIIRD